MKEDYTDFEKSKFAVAIYKDGDYKSEPFFITPQTSTDIDVLKEMAYRRFPGLKKEKVCEECGFSSELDTDGKCYSSKCAQS